MLLVRGAGYRLCCAPWVLEFPNGRNEIPASIVPVIRPGKLGVSYELPQAGGGPQASYPVTVRLTEFWVRMREQFGETYAESVAKDYVFSGLGGRTVNKALADGEDAKSVWRAVCETFNVPESLR